MDHHYLLTTWNAPISDFNPHESISTNSPHPPSLQNMGKSPKIGSPQQLMGVLLQICRNFDQELSRELNINRMLLQKLALVHKGSALQKSLVKFEEINEECVKFKSVEARRTVEEIKLRKLTVNDTKNISKNFGKAVITFIQKNPQKIRRILQHHNIDQGAFSNELKQRKKNLISISQLRSLWLDSQFHYAKPFRQISLLFLRRASYKYIFGSRIMDFGGHLKYRRRMIQALQQPQHFTSIKK